MRVSLTTRLFSGFAILLLLFSGVQIYSLVGLRRLGEEFASINRFHLSFSHQVYALETSQSQLLLLLKNLTTQEGDPDVRKRPALLNRWLRVTSEKRNETYAKLKRIVRQNRDHLDSREPTFYRGTLFPMLDQLETEWEQLTIIWNSALATDMDRSQVHALFRKENLFLSRVRQIVAVSRNRVRQLATSIEDRESELLRMQITLWVAALVLALAILVLLFRPLRMLARLTQGARRLGQGDFSHRIEVTGQDELGVLAAEFNSMTEAILEREARLIRSEQLAAAGKLSALIAHELRNPLAAISFQVELVSDLCRELPASRQQEELIQILEKVHREVDRMTGISEEYLEFSRLPQPQLKVMRLNAFLQDFCEFLEGELQLEGISLALHPDPTEPEIAGDERLLRQVLLNMVRNAQEAMPGGGELVLEIRAEKHEVIVEVRDTGCGIPEGVRTMLFDAFYTTKAHGTGLGLTVCMQILQQHGGRIHLQDSGQGTRFELVFPALDAGDAER